MFLTQTQIDAVDRRVRDWTARGPTADVNEAIDIGLAAYDAVEALAVVVADGIEASDGKVPFDLPSAKQIELLSRRWLEPVPAVLERIALHQAEGQSVPKAEAFRERVLDGRVAVSIPAETIAAQAESFAREGRLCVTTEEGLNRALSSRLGW